MRASTDAPVEGPVPPAHLWRPAGVIFLAGSLLALAVGSLPDFVLQPDFAREIGSAGGGRGLPALGVLVAAQAGGVMLFAPLVAGRRRARGEQSAPARRAGEYLVVVCACVPLYLAAATLSGAGMSEVARGVLYLTAAASGAWGLGLWAGGGRGPAAALVGVVAAIAAVGMPVAYYLLAEVSGLSLRPDWLWWAGPATCAYSVASAEGAWAGPAWAWALWPGVAIASGLVRLLVRRPAAREGRRL